MFRTSMGEREQMAMVAAGDLVPADHLLRLVDAVLDLSWVDEAVAPLYDRHLGAPTIPPQQVVRLLLGGFLMGVPGLRPMLRRTTTDVALRWFAGYGLTDRLPDHSSLSKILKRWGKELFEELFERVVQQCLEAGLVTGEMLHVDATLVRADVSLRSLTRRYVEQACGEDEAAAADEGTGRRPGEVRFAERGEEVEQQRKKRSRTDPDATLTTGRKNDRMEPRYKVHVAVDSGSGVAVDVAVTTGEYSEQAEFGEQLERVEERLGVRSEVVTADAGYASAGNYARLEARSQAAVIPPQRERGGRKRTDGTVNQVPLRRFRYDPHHDRVTCPRGVRLEPRWTDERGRWYQAPAEKCRACPLYRACVPASATSRTVRIGWGYEALLRARRAHERGWSEEWESARGQHRNRVEGWHGEAKRNHGLARAVFRGLDKVRVQACLTAATMNLKRLAWAAARATRGPGRQPRTTMQRLWGAFRAVYGTLRGRPAPIWATAAQAAA